MFQNGSFWLSNFRWTFLGRQKELEAQKKTGGALGNIFFVLDFLVVLQLFLIPDNRLQYDYIPKQHEFPCEYSIFLLNRVSKTHCDAWFFVRNHLQSVSNQIKYGCAWIHDVILAVNLHCVYGNWVLASTLLTEWAHPLTILRIFLSGF